MIIQWGKLNKTFWTMVVPAMVCTLGGFVMYVGQNLDDFVTYDSIEDEYSDVIEING